MSDRGLTCAQLATTMPPVFGKLPMRALLLVLCVVAASASAPVFAAPVGSAPPAKPVPEFAPRKAYRECLNRNFALRLTRERDVATPDAIAGEAVVACRTEERALAAFAEELMPVVKDRMKAFLVSGGHVPANLWWP
jgi:hypothetical protein